jgi:hypothetical protein
MNAGPANADPGVVPLTPEILRALAGLHDLQLQVVATPALGPAGWPLALLIGGLLLAGLSALYWAQRPKQRLLRRVRRLHRICRAAGEAQQRSGSPVPIAAVIESISALAGLLRDTAIDRRAMPPGLAGEAWLRWLDAQAPKADHGRFESGAGQDFLQVPFLRPPGQPSPGALALGIPPRALTSASAGSASRSESPPASGQPAQLDPARIDALFALSERWLRANA